ncbi:hypothetical protein ACHAWO_006876 [Cyclotella atomus]|uniref:Uncharacterized protein n=1 Tax=Cyclotella atomus TaxID=382360 RepID=A0ABD3QK62_9STRA
MEVNTRAIFCLAGNTALNGTRRRESSNHHNRVHFDLINRSVKTDPYLIMTEATTTEVSLDDSDDRSLGFDDEEASGIFVGAATDQMNDDAQEPVLDHKRHDLYKQIKKYFRKEDFRKEETPGGFKVYVETKKAKLERSISRECTKLEENVKRVQQSISDTKAVQKRLREDFEKSKSRRLVDFEKEMKRLRDLYDAEGERLNQKLIEDLDKNGAVDEKERELSDIEQQLNETKEYLDDLRNMNLGTTEQHTMIISGPNKLTDEQIGSLRDAGATVTVN